MKKLTDKEAFHYPRAALGYFIASLFKKLWAKIKKR